MARTPLLQALQQLARDFTEASERNISVEEVQEQKRSAISRRDLLKGAGGIAAGVALSDPLNLGGQAIQSSCQWFAEHWYYWSRHSRSECSPYTARRRSSIDNLRSLVEHRRTNTFKYNLLG